MTGAAPKSKPPLLNEGEDDDMTSIMSADQRKALRVASEEAEVLERDTARPPAPLATTGADALPAIPKAPGLPTLGTSPEAPRRKVAAATPAAPAAAPPATSRWPTALAFVMLLGAVAFALR